MNKKKKIFILGCIVLTLIMVIFNNGNTTLTEKNNPNAALSTNNKNNSSENGENQSEDKYKGTRKDTVEITAVGDILLHDEQLKAGFDERKKSYDFNNNFKYVKSYIEKSDLALANLETTLAGETEKYTGFPLFNSPDAIVSALKNTGFDILSTANNHCIDRGSTGVFRTVDVIKNNNIKVVGTRNNLNDKPYIIEQVKNIKIGIISYTYETPRKGNKKALNAIEIPSGLEEHINTFSYEHLDEDLIKIQANIEKMKSEGAEAIIFFIHWGNEYERKPNSYEKTIAQKLNEYGVDIILGSHPHVIQPIDFVSSDSRKKETLVVYSMGNFLSNQRYEHTKNTYTEDGVIINISIRKEKNKKSIIIDKVSFLPTWVYKYKNHEKTNYEIIPLLDHAYEENKFNVEGYENIKRAKNSRYNTEKVIKSFNSKPYSYDMNN